jgi:hypothetical protein
MLRSTTLPTDIRGRALSLSLAAMLIALSSFVVSSATANAAPPSPTVSLAQDGASMTEADGSCTITLVATWDSQELRGRHAQTRLYEQLDWGLDLRAAGFRVPDTGTARFVLRGVTPGAHTYEFQLVRGGQERVLAADTLSVSC